MKRDIFDNTTRQLNVADVTIPKVGFIWSSFLGLFRDHCGAETYWSKNGSNMMTSSPGSIKPMVAQSMPLPHDMSARNALQLRHAAMTHPHLLRL